MTRKRLLLFDIDGTLIRDSGAARESYAIALEAVYDFRGGVSQYDFSGKTDPEITHMVLGDAGYDERTISDRMPQLWQRYTSELRNRVDEARIHVLDGVFELLRTLESHPGVIIALLTGNIEPGARIKLAPHRLNEFFTFGAFGSDHKERQMLPPIAIERARSLHGFDFDARDVVVIGDSIYDVRCGVPHGATTIAVATGRTPREVLAAENPTHLFDSLEPTEALVHAVIDGA
jgi:phosphoglycolate phosphatase-like HAD superfamily hydrolase